MTIIFYQRLLISIFIAFVLLSCSGKAQTRINSLNCSIANKTYTVEYMLPSMFIPIESINFFKLQNGYYSTNVTVVANISSPVLNCSTSYNSTEFFTYNTSRTIVTGTSCFIVAPIVSNMNLTVTGSVAMNFTQQQGTYKYQGRFDCFGYIFINVTMPKPQPQPQPQLKPSIQSKTEWALIVGIINASFLLVIGLTGLVLYCLRKKRQALPLLNAYGHENYVRQQV